MPYDYEISWEEYFAEIDYLLTLEYGPELINYSYEEIMIQFPLDFINKIW